MSITYVHRRGWTQERKSIQIMLYTIYGYAIIRKVTKKPPYKELTSNQVITFHYSIVIIGCYSNRQQQREVRR